MSDLVISGAGGGGKGGGSGGGLSETPDTLKSNSYAQVLCLIGEGEIGGLVNGLQSIYADDTPVQNPDTSLNYKNVTYVEVKGTQAQAAITGFDSTRNEIVANNEAKFGIPVVKTITNTNVSAVVVTVQFPQMSLMDSKGNLGGTSVQYTIDVQVNGGGYTTIVNATCSGKAMSAYERQHRIQLPAGTTRNVRLTRVTADSASAQLNNKTFMKSYTEVVEAKLRYPNSAMIGVTVDASQFNSIPTLSFDVKLLKIKFPTNATVRADGSLNYSGSWDGTFQVGWCCCPAWAFYDMLTTGRYGLGDYISASQVDKFSLYTISQYCNTLISDGFGGTEPRFSCNILIENQQEAFKWVQDMASIFRGMSYWSSGSIYTSQDAPGTATYLFNNANVIDGLFNYQGSSAKSRHTVALVTWNDPADAYRQNVEYVEGDPADIAQYGIIDTPVTAVGCTSRGQAARVGKWILYTEKYETDIVTFKTGAEGVIPQVGSYIKIADQYRAGQRLGGRVVSATGTTVTVDGFTTTPTLPATVYLTNTTGTVTSYGVSSITGNVITISGTISPVPVAQSSWILASSAVTPQDFRVLSVSEADDGSFEINALEYYSGKYALVENGLTLPTRSYTSVAVAPATPTGLTVSQIVITVQDIKHDALSVVWTHQNDATEYKVEWRFNSGQWYSDTAISNNYDILDVAQGSYDVRVTAMTAIGTPSTSYASATITVTPTGGLDKSALPFATTNRVILSQFEKGTTGWSLGASTLPSPAVNATLVSSLPPFINVSATATTAGQATNIISGYNSPCTVGEQLAVSAYILTGTNTTAQLNVEYFTANGTFLSDATVGAVVPAGTVGGVVRQAMLTVPASAAWVRIWYATTAVAAGAVSASMAQPMIQGVPAGQTVFPVFTAGPISTPGADVTSANTAANIAGQTAWATYTAYAPDKVTQPSANLLFNSGFNIGTSGFSFDAGWAGPDVGNGDVGKFYMHTGTNNLFLYSTTPQKIPVFGSGTYTFQVWAAATGTSSGTNRPKIYIDWHDSAGTYISGSAATYIQPGVGYATWYVTATAPSTAVYARVVMHSAQVATGGGAIYTSKWKIELGGVPSPYTDEATNSALYQSGQTIDSLQPAQAGADVTGSNTAANIAGQAAWATYTSRIPSDLATTVNSGGGVAGEQVSYNAVQTGQLNTFVNASQSGSLNLPITLNSPNGGTGTVVAAPVITSSNTGDAIFVDASIVVTAATLRGSVKLERSYDNSSWTAVKNWLPVAGTAVGVATYTMATFEDTAHSTGTVYYRVQAYQDAAQSLGDGTAGTNWTITSGTIKVRKYFSK